MAYLTLFCRKFSKNSQKKSQRSGRGGGWGRSSQLGRIPNFYRKFVLVAPLSTTSHAMPLAWVCKLPKSPKSRQRLYFDNFGAILVFRYNPGWSLLPASQSQSCLHQFANGVLAKMCRICLLKNLAEIIRAILHPDGRQESYNKSGWMQL